MNILFRKFLYYMFLLLNLCKQANNKRKLNAISEIINEAS